MSESRDESLNRSAGSNEQARSQDSQLIAEAEIHESEREALKKAREAEIADFDSAGGEAGYGNLHFGEQKTNEDLSADPTGREAGSFETPLHDDTTDTDKVGSQPTRQDGVESSPGSVDIGRDGVAPNADTNSARTENTGTKSDEPTTTNAEARLNTQTQPIPGETASVSAPASQASPGPLRGAAYPESTAQSSDNPQETSEGEPQTEPTDTNAAPSSLTLSDSSVDENDAGAVVATLSSTDADEGDSATYTLSEDSSGLFEVVGNELKLKDGLTLDHEVQDTYTVTLMVTDAAGASFEQAVTINVADVNEGPTSLTLSNTTVDENAVGSVVATLSSTDVDDGDTATYSLSDDASGLFEVVGNELKLKDGFALDHEAQDAYSVTLMVTDTAGASFEQTITINVADLNEGPGSLILSDTGVDENATGAVVATLSSTDVDEGDTATYSLSDDTSGLFEVVGNELKLKDGVALDHEAQDAYTVTLMVTDTAGASFEQTVTINVADLNEGPTGVALSSNTVDENDTGAIVGTLTTTDVDDGDIHSYEVSDQRFEVVDGNLKLKDGVTLDHETAETIDVTVTATDAGGLATTQEFSINVADLNEVPTTVDFISTRQVNIENAGFEDRTHGDQQWGQGADGWTSTGSSGDWNPAARSLSAEASEGDNVAYINSGKLAQTLGETFSDSGFYTLSVDVGNRQDIGSFGDYEIRLFAGDELIGTVDGGAPGEGEWHTVSLDVSASDFPDDFAGFGENLRIELVKESGGQVNFDNVQLTVTDPGTDMNVPENHPGAQIAILSTVDPDDGDSHSYTVSDDRFEVVDGALKLKDGVSLNHEEVASVNLVVTATDSGGLSVDQDFTLQVGDLNEAPSNLGLDGNSVGENDAGATIGALTVNDVDDGDGHVFTVSDDRFEVVDGNLKLKDGVSLNHESAESVDVTVIATDAGGLATEQAFSISVGDVNEAPTDINFNSTRDVQIDNAGFENREHADQRWGRGTENWESTGSSGDWNPAQRSLAAEASEGDNVAYINSGALSQTLGEEFSPTTTYELSVDVGNRQDIAGYGDYEVRLFAGDELIGTADGGAPSEGGWETVSLQVNGADFPEGFSGFGDNIRIELVKEGGGQVNFDNVRMTASEQADPLSINENEAGANVGAINVVDEDNGDSHTFVVSDDRFEVVNGALKLKDGVSLNHESTETIDVIVTATDAGGLSTSSNFSINVADVNEAPVEFVLEPNQAQGALSLNHAGGSDDVAISSDVEGFPTDALTVEVTFTSSQTDVGSGVPLFSYAANGGHNNEALIWLESSSGKLNVFLAGRKFRTDIDNDALLNGEEHQVSFTWDQASDQLNVYVDGVNEYSTSVNVRDLRTDGTVTFGQEQDSEGGRFDANQIFEGEIAEVRIFDHARSAEEVANNADAPFDDPGSVDGLVTNWVMNHSENGVVSDLVGGNDLVLQNGAEITGGETFATPTIAENVDGATVGILSAIDPDTDAPVNDFAIADDPSGLFEVVGNELKLKDGVAADFESQDSYEIVLQASDETGLSTETTVTINVADVNEAPVAIELSNNTVNENDAGVTVATLSSTDPDAGDSAAYALSSDASGLFEVVGNELKVKDGVSLDHESQDSHEITLTVTDSAGESFEQTVTINVADVNEGPTSLTLSDNSVDENDAGATVATLSSNDPDAGDSAVYALSDDASGLFEVSGNELKLKDGVSLDHESQDSYEVTLSVTDNAGESFEQTVTIDVADVNEGPTSLTLSDTSVDENEAGATVARLTSTDVDEGDSATYALSDDASGLFEVVGNELKLKEGVSLDHEAQDSYEVTLSVTDNAGESFEQTVTIDVADVNDAPTAVQLSSNSVGESVVSGGNIGSAVNQSGVVVGDLSITDQDGDAASQYQLTDADGNPIDHPQFEIVGNQVVVKSGAVLDYESTPTVDVYITATDSGGASTTQSFTLELTDSEGSFVGDAGNNVARGTSEEDNISGGEGNDYLAGNDGNDTISGDGGNDRIIGGDGADELHGGAGNDLIYADSEDTAVTGGEGTDRVIVQGDGDFTIDQTASGVERVDGGAGNDQMDATGMTDRATQLGNAGDDTLTGGEGSDVQYGGADNDVISGGGGNDIQRGDDGNDVIDGGAGNDVQRGGDGNDTISGGEGNDNIQGNAGADELHGGAGNDLIYADSDDTAVTGGEGTDRVIVQGDGDFTIDQTASSVERVDGGAGNDQMDATGMTDRATQLGNAGDDTLTGGEGSDVQYGGADNDVISGGGGNDVQRGDDGNDVIDGGAGNDVQRGGDGNDTISGGEGNDNIQGNAGADELHGGAGNDLIYADGDDTAVTGGEGSDRVIVQGDGDFTIDQTASSVERVDGGAGNDQMDATGMTDRVTQLGNDGDDTITGGDGNDVQRGGDGSDVISGGDGNDNIQGNAGADELHGGAGNDLIYADSEDTAVTGGEGSDRVIVQGDGDFTIDQNASSVERVDGGAGNDQLDATGMTDRATQLGNDGDDTLTGGSGNDVQRGGDGNDVVYGGDGNDNIQGNAGADELHGGAGNDLIYADSEDTAVTGGEGTDRVIVQGDGDFTIDQTASSVERVDGGTGNDQMDATGMTERATQLGNGGDDTLTGGSGNDVQRGGDGNDVVAGGDGNDNMQGNDGTDRLIGGAGDDYIDGGEGDDTAVFSGARGDYTVTQLGENSFRITDDRPGAPDGSDRVLNVENFEFSDGTVPVEHILNEAPTSLSLSDTSVDENDAGATVATLSSTDVDEGDSATYALSDDASGLFEVVGNELKLKDGVSLDHEGQDSYEVSLTVTDGAGASFEQTVTIDVADVNEGPTSLTLSDTSVDENDAGATVATLSSTDVDEGDSATYALSDDASGLFEVVGNELKLKDGVSLDHEAQDSYEVTVSVTDDAGASFEQTVTIDVTDVNEPTVVGDVDLGQTSEDTSVVISEAQLLSQSHDPEGAALSVTDASVDPAYGSLTDNGDGSWTFTPEQDLAVDDVPISFDVSDGSTVQSAVASIDVAAVADAPTITLGTVTQEELGESNTVNSGFEIEGVDVSRSGSDWIGSLGDWETTSEAIEVKQETLADGSTNQFIELNDDARNYYDDATNIVRTIETEDGATYTIDFENAARPGYDGSVNEIEVVINGEVVETISADGTGSSAINWESNSVTFVGDGSDATVEFRASGVAQDYGRGMFLDDVVITEELPVGHAAGDGQIALPEISVAATDSDGSETVSTVISDIPDGFIISDGTNTFTSSEGVDSVDISDWAQDQMMVTPADGFTGEVSLNVTATSTDGADQTETTEAITVNVEPSDDVLTGGAGNDTIAGGGGNDTISGEGGNDVLSGGSGNDVINGGAGDDTITGGTGDDNLDGGSGDDIFIYAQGDGSDVIDGGAGGGWTDAIQIEGGVASLGSFGSDWTVELTEGSVTAQDSDSITFSEDAAGSITFSDGSTVEFENLEQII